MEVGVRLGTILTNYDADDESQARRTEALERTMRAALAHALRLSDALGAGKHRLHCLLHTGT